MTFTDLHILTRSFYYFSIQRQETNSARVAKVTQVTGGESGIPFHIYLSDFKLHAMNTTLS